ncbi:MAG: hypothetical protein HYU66_04585 [Armatimonadetes bacterium]|nr:hypothetical protein [Armatimonadota bacterium]
MRHVWAVLVLLLVPTGANALTGHLGFLRSGAAYVMRLDAPRRQPTKLPWSEGATAVALSPWDGTAVYSVSLGKDVAKVVVSARPYRAARRLPVPSHPAPNTVLWAGHGAVAFIGKEWAGGWCWQYAERSGVVRRLPYRVTACSADAEVVLVDTGVGLNIRWRATGREVPVWSSRRRRAALDELRRLNRDGRLDFYLAPGIPYAERYEHVVATVTPDGRSVVLASTLGVPHTANGSHAYMPYRLDLRRDALQRLGWADVLGGMGFLTWSVAPDGCRLLSVMGCKDGPRHTADSLVLDLSARRVKALDWPESSERAGMTTCESPACWSPDSRFVAVPGTHDAIAGERCTVTDEFVTIRETATDRQMLRVPGAQCPSWSR